MNPDQSEIATIEQRLKSCSKRLHQLAPQVGSAKQIRQYDSDRRKNLLAKFVVEALKEGETATAAESIGRANAAYQTQLESLSKELEAAEACIAAWDAEMCSFEASRSLLAMSRETMRNLEG